MRIEEIERTLRRLVQDGSRTAMAGVNLDTVLCPLEQQELLDAVHTLARRSRGRGDGEPEPAEKPWV